MTPQTQDRELAARRHLAYRYVLRKCLRLAPYHAKVLTEAWNCDLAYLRRLGFRSAPQTEIQRLFLEYYTENFIDLQGVAGFYVSLDKETKEPRWRFNAPPKCSVLRPFYNSDNLIQGVLVYRNARDMEPYLLSSKGLWAGTKAIHFDPLRHH